MKATNVARLLIVSAALAIGLIVFGIFITRPAEADPPASFRKTQLISSGISNPTTITFAPDGRLFIAQRDGTVKIYTSGNVLAEPFIQLPAWAEGDRGLLGITFDPDFQNNKYVYLHYVSRDTFIYLIRVKEENNVAVGAQELLYKTTVPTEWMHTAGALAFGPDGKIYIGVGDNNTATNSQDLTNPFGKILRLNTDGSIPSDNPFVGLDGKLTEIWAYGLRNPWRLQFDRTTGNLYVSDVGGDIWEEINRIEKGINYGWPDVEGPCNPCQFYNPVYAYQHDSSGAAVVGGPIYRSAMFPSEYDGNILFGDFVKGTIQTVSLDGQSVNMFDDTAGAVVDMKIGPDGAVYFVTFYPGAVYRIAYERENRQPVALSQASTASGTPPLSVHFTSNGSYDPDGDDITYQWDFGDGTTSTEQHPQKTFEKAGSYTVQLAVSDKVSTVNSVPITVTAGQAPNVRIVQPEDGATYRDGDTISYQITATDSSSNTIANDHISLEVVFHHDEHAHPLIGPLVGAEGTFTIPRQEETSSNTWYELIGRATDVNGIASSHVIHIHPAVNMLNINLSPNTYFQVPEKSITDGYVEICETSTGPCIPHWQSEDNGGTRGIVTTFHRSTWVKSPWGVFISNTLSIPELSQAMRDHGCVNGCSDIVERTIE